MTSLLYTCEFFMLPCFSCTEFSQAWYPSMTSREIIATICKVCHNERVKANRGFHPDFNIFFLFYSFSFFVTSSFYFYRICVRLLPRYEWKGNELVNKSRLWTREAKTAEDQRLNIELKGNLMSKLCQCNLKVFRERVSYILFCCVWRQRSHFTDWCEHNCSATEERFRYKLDNLQNPVSFSFCIGDVHTAITKVRVSDVTAFGVVFCRLFASFRLRNEDYPCKHAV